MATVNLNELVGKLSNVCKRSLEAAAGLCLSRTNYNVEVEHWLIKLLEVAGSDLAAILKEFEVDSSRLTTELTRSIERFKTGNGRAPALSPQLVTLAKEAWLLASIDYQSPRLRSGHLLCAILGDAESGRLMIQSAPQLEKINVEALRKSLTTLTSNTLETEAPTASAAPAAAHGAPGKGGPTKTPSLDQYTIDLTDQARKGKIDPVLGRDSEIRQIIDILMRRRQNNPILTGEAGVGKTAVVEGFAIQVAAGEVPPPLKNAAVRTLDLGLLQAGAGVKGEFENRLKQVIDEVKSSPTPIILFIDEAHTMIGAGGAAGQGDAANMLKPALARGELRTIAATTWAEYKKYFERDAALARRFQVVKVEEPTEASAVEMMRGMVATLEKHHKVRILNEAVLDAVKLSHRYISGRQLPDKSVSLLDTTCARIGLSQHSTPPQVEDLSRQIMQLGRSIDLLQREILTGAKHQEAIEAQRALKAKAEEDFKTIEVRWKQELELVKEIGALRDKIEGRPAGTVPDPAAPAASALVAAASPAPTGEALEKLQAELQEKQQALRSLQGEEPLVHECVNSVAIGETVASWTGIPVGRMMADEVKTVLNLKSLMEEAIIGQSHALEEIAQSIKTSRANLTDPSKPIGVFLLAGTSGVGKTETAITLANLLYGGEQNMTVLNMSEFKEEHKVSLLMGSPPGYIGYGEGGVLTEAVRRKPYSVVLLDEMEKAHPGIQDVFYQVFDKGAMRDGEGRDINFKNTVILMTTNAGTDLIKSLCADPDTMPDAEEFGKAVFPELLKTFKPAFLGRVKIIPYYPLGDDVMRKIIELKLGKVARRVKEHYNAPFTWTNELVSAVAARCTEVDTGARNVDHILTRTLLPQLSTQFLSRMAEEKAINRVNVTAGADGKFVYDIE